MKRLHDDKFGQFMLTRTLYRSATSRECMTLRSSFIQQQTTHGAIINNSTSESMLYDTVAMENTPSSIGLAAAKNTENTYFP